MEAKGFPCRYCDHLVTETFADLGHTPLANSYLSVEQLYQPEIYYPLEARVCSNCFLVQLDAFETPEHIFSDYAYFSSYATSWVEHAKIYAHQMIQKLSLNAQSMVIEIASNDGYLLQHFRNRDIPILGIEPAENVALKARENGIPTDIRFFGAETATELVSKNIQADLLIGNNVLAHVPNLNDFVKGLAILLKPGGRITLEFPHLAQLIKFKQFDTVYHEHFSYFSLFTLEKLFAQHHLHVIDIEELSTHGGSLRVHLSQLSQALSVEAQQRIERVRSLEKSMGLDDLTTYRQFNQAISKIKFDLLEFLIQAYHQGQTVVGYGAAAKGNTMINTCGIRPDLLPYTVDISPHKQNRFLPGSHIPIFSPEHIFETQPDFVWILPWNLTEEITDKMSGISQWGGQFVTAIPELKVFKS